ncbi:MAG: tetratricopeptide repeat protein [candidate division Zixibacteria bacterium]|nr:tetratricopeptide repeat protein [candidate division Zixibacteria bacterium]
MMEVAITHTKKDDLCSELMDGFVMLDLARGWLKQGNTVVALELLKSALESPDADLNQELRARVLKETGRARMMQSEWDSSEQYYLEAQRIYLDLENLKGASECARNCANMYFQRGRYQESANLCEKALKWASAINDHELRATILNTLAAIKSATGDLKEAIKTFKLCLADFQSAGNHIREGYVLLNIGLTQTELGEHAEAVRSLNQALAVALDEKDQSLVEICYQNIAKCYLAQNDTILAKSVIDTARKILPGLNSKALETELNLIDCRIMHAMGNIENAEGLAFQTYQMALENNMTALQADILKEHGLIYKDKGQFDLAIAKLDASANLYKQLGIDNGFKQAVEALEYLKRRAYA